MLKNFIKTMLIGGTAAVMLSVSASATCVGMGYVDADALRLRAEPDTSAEIVDTAVRDDVVVLLEECGDWFKVSYNLESGYMHRDYLVAKGRETVDLGVGRVNVTSVNLRSGPSTDNDVIMGLFEGNEFDIIGINNLWYKVVYNGTTGYVYSDYVDLTTCPPDNDSTNQGDSLQSADEAAKPDVTAYDYEALVANFDYEQYTDDASAIIAFGKQLLGCPYVYGGASPAGFDCSGFVQYCFKNFGYELTRTAASQQNDGEAVDMASLQPGDLVFFSSYGGSPTHSGIYIGEGQFIHSATGGVKITDLDGYWYSTTYCGACRVLG